MLKTNHSPLPVFTKGIIRSSYVVCWQSSRARQQRHEKSELLLNDGDVNAHEMSQLQQIYEY
jgi:hypothetical protein